MEAKQVETGCTVESTRSAVYEVPHSGKKLEERMIEEEMARLGK